MIQYICHLWPNGVPHLRRCAVLLIYGLALTTLIAWIASALLPRHFDLTTPTYTWPDSHAVHWAGQTRQCVAGTDLYARAHFATRDDSTMSLSPPGWSKTNTIPTLEDCTNGAVVVESARGWPFLALAWRTTYSMRDLGNNVDTGVIRIDVPLRVARMIGRDRVELALLPIWNGLALNTILAASGLQMAFIVIKSLQRHKRRRSGRCAACGYDLRHLHNGINCPECGAMCGPLK